MPLLGSSLGGIAGGAPPPGGALGSWARAADEARRAPFIELEGSGRGVEAPRGFGALLDNLVTDAREKDTQAQTAIEAFARGDDPGRIHEVMVAVSKAEIALRTVASVRNKLLEAYRDLQHVTA